MFMHKLNENYTSIDMMAGQLLQRKTATGREFLPDRGILSEDFRHGRTET